MRRFVRHEGVAAVLRTDNVDTDVIIPLGSLMSVPRAKLGDYAFEPLRFDADGNERPAFVLNQEPYRRASILVAGRNFGSGSSREGAVQALEGFGLCAVVAPSFGDIFFGNCIKNGLLPIVLDDDEVARLMRAAEESSGEAPFVIDLAEQTIVEPSGRVTRFDLDPGSKARLMEGQDEISITLGYEGQIGAYQTADRERRPWVWDLPELPYDGSSPRTRAFGTASGRTRDG